jgi:preprotein translocase subunit SecD
MKKAVFIFVLVLFIGGINSTVKSDTPIRYVLCSQNVQKIEVIAQGKLYSLQIVLTASAAEDFFRLTRDNIGKTLNIEFDNEFITGADIVGPIKSGYLVSVPATKEEADNLKESILSSRNNTACGKLK